ncbi:MAG: tetratricopeptide repeat protein [Bacteroidota bacterium]|nr:tetratricopeptide repeat protein [Bacteroidota bacterium]
MKSLVKLVCLLAFALITLRANALFHNDDGVPQKNTEEKFTNASIQTRLDSLKLKLADTVRIRIMYQLANLLGSQKPHDALKFAEMALRLSDSLGYMKGKISSLLNSGKAQMVLADYPKALHYWIETHKLARQTHNYNIEGIVLQNIGGLYVHLKKYDLARKYYTEALLIKKRHSLEKDQIGSYLGLGIVYLKQEKYRESNFYFFKALNIASKDNDPNDLSSIFSNIGTLYANLKQYDTAIFYYKKAIEMEEKGVSNVWGSYIAYMNLGLMYVEKSQTDEGLKYLLKAKKNLESSTVRFDGAGIYLALSEAFAKKKDFEKAYANHRVYHSLSDSVVNETITRQISEMQAQFESRQKEEQIKILQKDKELAEAKTRKRELLDNSLLAGLGLVMIICIILYRSVRNKLKLNGMLTLKNIEIESQRLEIEMKSRVLNEFNKELMKENISARYETLKSKINPHFLFNCLNTLTTLIVKDRKAAVSFVGIFSKLYRNILSLSDHQFISLRKELELTDNYLVLQETRFGENLKVIKNISENDLDKLVPPFSLQLLIENAIKHNMISQNHTLKVIIEANNGKLIVSNNLQPRFHPEPSTGIGQKNIIERYKLAGFERPVFTIEKDRYIATIPLFEKEIIET